MTRPRITLSYAQSLDGSITAVAGQPLALSGPEAMAFTHQLRASHDAILVGIGTVLADNPRLTDRTGLPRRRPLLRVVVDSRLRLPLNSKLVRSAEGDVLVFTAQSPDLRRARALRRVGIEVVRVRSRANRPDLAAVVEELGRREILSVLLEGGARLNWAALEAGIVDKMFLFYAPRILGAAGVPVARAAARHRARALRAVPALQNLTLHRFGPDFAVEGYLRDVYRNR